MLAHEPSRSELATRMEEGSLAFKMGRMEQGEEPLSLDEEPSDGELVAAGELYWRMEAGGGAVSGTIGASLENTLV